MFVALELIAFAGCVVATLHHVYVGQTEGSFIHALEMDDAARQVYEMGMIPAAGASPSMLLAPGEVSQTGFSRASITHQEPSSDRSTFSEANLRKAC
jgi:hypothetical protein